MWKSFCIPILVQDNCRGRVATQLNKTLYIHHPYSFPLRWITVWQPSIYTLPIFVHEIATPFTSTPLQPWSVLLPPSDFVTCSVLIPICPFLEKLNSHSASQLFASNGTDKFLLPHNWGPRPTSKFLLSCDMNDCCFRSALLYLIQFLFSLIHPL